LWQFCVGKPEKIMVQDIQNCNKSLDPNSNVFLLNDLSKDVEHSKLLDYVCYGDNTNLPI
jgi:hypothetical protein